MKALLVGVGQAGGKIAQALVDYDRRTGFGAVRAAIAVNTAEADLAGLDIDSLLVGQSRVGGRGVGGDSELGAEIMTNNAGEVLNAIGKRSVADVEAILLIAALGGGTGSGGVSVLAHELKRVYDMPVYALGVLPGADEGTMQQANAGRSLKTLLREVDSLLLVDNDAWQSEGESLGAAFQDINARIARRLGLLLASGQAGEGVGESVVDTSEVINTLGEGGIAALGYASAAAGDEAAENVTTVVSLTRQALASGMSVPGTTEATAALIVIAGRPAAIPRKGIERARRVVEEETGTVQVRGGDFPVDDEKLAAIVLVSGIEGSGRVTDVMSRAAAAGRAQTRDRRDSVEGLRSDELDDLF